MVDRAVLRFILALFVLMCVLFFAVGYDTAHQQHIHISIKRGWAEWRIDKETGKRTLVYFLAPGQQEADSD